MVDLDILNRKGCSKDDLKRLFSAPTKSKDIERLLRLIKSRIEEGQSHNISNFRIYQALDSAWNTPLKQITATMLQSLIDSNMNVDQMQDTLKTWGVDVSEVLLEVPDPKDPTRTIKKVNVPAFFRIFVPLCRSYLSIRRAKTMNDRKLVPFMKFEPAISNEKTRIRCEVITSRVEEMSNDYGFWNVEDQAFWRTLHYGQCFRFPVESWHYEEQLVESDSEYEGEVDDEDKTVKRIRTKEGLRYHMPHPTRTFYDMAWPAHTFNTDSGATYAGYWRVMRYGEIVNKKDYFNLGSIKVGNTNEWFSKNKAFFDNVYPCRMQFPVAVNNGVGTNDTERKISEAFYTNDDHDKGLVVTEKFAKLIPSEWGIGTYDCPVWFRFVMANNDTPIYAEALPYSPIIEDDYDGVSGQVINPSMSLEILPFQDHFANLLSQYLLSVKSNLANMILVDTDVVDEADLTTLERWSQKLWSSFNFIRFSSRRFFKSQQQPVALFPQRFPQVDTGQIALAMKTVLEILERVLVMSSQELGQSASHEQTREEVRNIATSTSTRAQFTASTLDRSRQAWKKQIYEGLMAYGSEEGYAQVPADPKITPKMLAKLGFTDEGYDDQKKKRTVKWSKTAIRYAAFAANRDGDDRINDVEIARSLSAFMQQLVGNPMTAQAIGPDQFIAMANIIARAAGLPRDFRFVNRGPDVTPEEQGQQILQQVQQMLQELEGKIAQEVQGALKQVIDENRHQEMEISQLMQAVGIVGEQNQGPMGPPQPPPQIAPPPPQALPVDSGVPPGAPPPGM